LELGINEFVNSNQILKQKDFLNSKENLSKFFTKSDFNFESVLILGKELHPGFGSCLRRRKGRTGPQGELREVSKVVDTGLSMGTMRQGAHGAA
jgi:hypothetical protein